MKNEVIIVPGEVTTSATVARGFLTAAVAESRRDAMAAVDLLSLAISELQNLQRKLADNPSKG